MLDNLVLGGAFSHILSDNDFDHNRGHADNGAYLSSLYGTFVSGGEFLHRRAAHLRPHQLR